MPKRTVMSIVTRKGDRGRTSLYKGGYVYKDDARMKAAGTVDELCVFLGMPKVMVKSRKIAQALSRIQQDLFLIGAEVACEKKKARTLKKRIDATLVGCLEDRIALLEKKDGGRVRRFQLPGGSLLAVSFDMCRTIARRLERELVTLQKKRFLSNDHVLCYVNRLSDLLYLWARAYQKPHVKS